MSTATASGGRRLLSLDVFRGLTVAAMILVNSPGEPAAVYAPLHHVIWNGWRLTETIAPAFLWIVGVGIAFGLARAAQRGLPAAAIAWRAARRAAVLFLLGLLINAVPRAFPMFQAEAWRTLRFPGILQRIAVCGFLATLLARRASRRTLIVTIVILLATHSLLLVFVPPPGQAAAQLTPRGTIAWWLDWTLLGSHSKASFAFDPLGILGTLTGLASVLLGVLAGRRVLQGQEPARTAADLATGGSVLLLAGTAMAGILPINESLWTASYTVLMAGVSTCAFACLYWWIDGLGRSRRVAGPFVAFGRNALLLFVGSQLLTSLLAAKGFARGGRWVSLRGHLHEALMSVVSSPAFASFLYALLFVAFFFLLAVLLDRRRWYWTV